VKLPRLALFGFLAATVAVHAIVGWWQPIQTDDWDQLAWGARHAGHWVAGHYTFSDVMAYALPSIRPLHAAVCAIGQVAIVLGIFMIARRRWPRPDAWSDVLEVVAVSALVWIAQPRAGFTLFARPNVAAHVCGCAVAVWLIAAFRCRWRVGRGGTLALVLAGVLVGTSTRQIATATLVGLALWVRRTPPAERAGWMRVVLAVLFVATVVGFVDPPHVELLRVFNRGLEPNLLLLNVPLREGGQLISLLLLLALARRVLEAVRPGASPDAGADELPPPRETLSWFWTWLGTCVACLFGPRYGEATLLPATLVLVIAALPYVRWLCATRALRRAIAVTVVGVHVLDWATALPLFAGLDDEFHDRVARLERTPAGGVAVIAPYSEALPTSWFYGEDFALATRQRVGIERFGVRDIAFEPRFGKLETNPRLDVRLAADGLTAGQVRAASPAYWATEVSGAREQFEVFAARAERSSGRGFTAQLVVGGLEFAERNGRPLYIAWYERGSPTAPRSTRGNPDPTDRQQITLPAALAAALPEAYILDAGVVKRATYDAGGYRVQPMVAGVVAVIACDPQRCLLVDAFVPRF